MRHKLLGIALAAMVWAMPGGAYYHFIHYTGRGTPYFPVPEKYDLPGLPNKTITFFVSDTGPAQFGANDSFPSVLSQVRQAAQVWNSVETSDLRVAFGGLYTAGVPQASPGAAVVFEDLPPGVLAYGGPTTRSTPVAGTNGLITPIMFSEVHLSLDFTQRPGPSYSEGFFLTVVHEMGHSLGLQHTFTSSAMSTAATRATSLSRPIDVDDIAGISLLYPNAKFGSQTGSIKGQVVWSQGSKRDQGVHMASVVAIRNGAAAISAMTNPDGTYRIDGVPPGQYFVYAHALPPTADIVSPEDPDGNPVAPDGAFDTLFYPGTKNVLQASNVGVAAGALSDKVNFAVKPRSSIPIYGVGLFSYFNQNTVAVKPAFLNLSSFSGKAIASGAGLGSNGKATDGLNVQIMGGAANLLPNGIYAYAANGTTYLELKVGFTLAASPGPQHLIFSQPDYLYVLPSGLNLVQKAPPSISAISNNGDGTVTVAGTGFASDSLIYFDGLPAAVRSMDVVNQTAIVAPPTGASAQNATAAIYNSDGQNSFFLQGNAPVTFSYDTTSAPFLTYSPSSLPAGSEAMVSITGTNTQFAQGATVAGFGSSDAYVRRLFVLDATHLLADVAIPAGASNTTTEVSAVSGFQIAAQPGGFQILPPAGTLPVTVPVLINAVAGQSGTYPGAIMSLFGANLVSGNAPPRVTFNNAPATLLYSSPTQINLQIPNGLLVGPAILRLNNGVENNLPVAVAIDPAPALIAAILNSAGASVNSNSAARPGDVITLALNGLADAGTVVATSRVRVNVGGVDFVPLAVTQVGNTGTYQVQFSLSDAVKSGLQPVIVYIDGRSSLQNAINIANP